MRKSAFFKRCTALLILLTASVVASRAANVIGTNTAGGNWNVTNNWSPNTVPASGDTVFITNAGTYAVTVNVSPTLAGLTVGNTNGGMVTVNLASATLTLNGASYFNTNTVFNFSGGTFDGTGTVIFAGQFTWSGGFMDSSTPGGKTVFTNTATVTINGSTKTYYRRTVDNYTTVTWTAGTLLLGFAAIWNNLPGASFDLQGDLNTGFIGGGVPVFNNAGTLRKSAGAGAASFGFSVNNANTVVCQSGTLALANGGASSGNFTANASCNLDFSGGTQTLLTGANFAGAGLFRIKETLI